VEQTCKRVRTFEELPALRGQKELYALGAVMTAEHWADQACAFQACLILLMSGPITLAPILDHCLGEEGATLFPD
jgi:hypothetical protein